MDRDLLRETTSMNSQRSYHKRLNNKLAQRLKSNRNNSPLQQEALSVMVKMIDSSELPRDLPLKNRSRVAN